MSKTKELLQKSEALAAHQKDQLEYLSNHDTHTGCLNRKALHQQLELDIESSIDSEGGLAILMIGIDQLNLVNECYGRSMGDNLVITLADILKSKLSKPHYVARYGTNEFCCVMTSANLSRPLHNSGFHLGQDFGIPGQSNSGCLDGPVFT